MKRWLVWLVLLGLLALAGCSTGSGASDADAGADVFADHEADVAPDVPVDVAADADSSADGSAEADAEAETDASAEVDDGWSSPACDEVAGWVADYRAAHPGRDGDINMKTPAQIAADPEAARLLALCGPGQRPVIPLLAWEYGGADHPWINPEASPLVICVYIPVSPSSDHWQYDTAADRVMADVYVLFPECNPCADRVGAHQVADCIGEPTNFEILIDIASLHDGADAGLSLSEASTELLLILADGTKVHMLDG